MHCCIQWPTSISKLASDDYTMRAVWEAASFQNDNLKLQIKYKTSSNIVKFNNWPLPLRSHHFGHPLSSFTNPDVRRNRNSNHLTNHRLMLSVGEPFAPHFFLGRSGATKILKNPASKRRLSLKIQFALTLH